MRILELFAGIGACSTALKRIGINLEIVDAVEIDKYAMASFNAIHGTNFEVQDICEWDKDLKDIDLITHGSPCFLKGERVNTKEGFKNIENIKIGDYVKSHNGNYNKVLKTFKSRNNKIVDIKASAVHNINTTDNHPFLVKRNNKVGWLQAKELTTKDFLCVPINKKQEDIKFNSNLPIKSIRFWYLIGRFIGDGWITKRKERNYNISGIKICCGKDELEDLKNKLCNILHYCIVEDKTTYKLQFTNKELGEFCSQFGIGAKNKHIPQWVLDLKKEYLEYLLMGIIDSDGCFSQNKYKVTTISRDLAYNIGELVLKVKNVPYHLYKTVRPKKHKIEDREVNQNDTYQITWGNNYSNNINFLDNDFLYSRVRKIKRRTEINNVYNIEVENTHSYCVNNIATHNCQDFSVAGKQAGGDLGSGTRSSLMYETIRIVGKIRPKYILWENVKNLLSKKHKHNFDAYIETMNILGYNSYYQVLNAKDYGIPQNRERVYTISIRKDIDVNDFKFPQGKEPNNTTNKVLDLGTAFEQSGRVYDSEGLSPTIMSNSHVGGYIAPKVLINGFKFPQKEELKLRLKDMLEDEVDEKYYLKDYQIENIKKSTFMVNKRRIQEKDYCDTLCARDWKDPKCVQVGTLDIKGIDQIKRVYSPEGLSPTVSTCQGGNTEPKIITYNITRKVKVRKYDVDIDKLKQVLKEHKKYSNKEIALILDLPITTVEHWFRSDNCFSIPDPQIWLRLKSLLNIKTDEFDKSIMTFEEREGVYEKADRLYDEKGLAPTLTQQQEKIKENYRIRKLTPKECWRLMGFSDEDFEKAANIPTSNTQLYKQAGNSIVVDVLERIFKNLLEVK